MPNFAPEIFRRAVLKDPLKMKALQKGLSQLCEEGATQLFKPLRNNDLILGAVGQLQFEVVAFRLQDEYSVQCVFDPVTVYTARWVEAADARKLEEFRARAHDHLAIDHSGALVYLAPSRVNLQLTLERWPDIRFRETREHADQLPEAGWRTLANCATYAPAEVFLNDVAPVSPLLQREASCNALYEAAELEHNLMCTYLYAAFSLKDGEAGGR